MRERPPIVEQALALDVVASVRSLGRRAGLRTPTVPRGHLVPRKVILAGDDRGSSGA